MDQFTIGFMNIEHLDEVMALEHLCFTTPWSRMAFETELSRNQYALYIVGQSAGKIVAYAGTWVVLDEAHITNVAVHPEFRGFGYGKSILIALLQLARDRGATRATLEVRTSNLVAQGLYNNFGFVTKGVRKGYYTDTGEDALLMWKDDLSDIPLA